MKGKEVQTMEMEGMLLPSIKTSISRYPPSIRTALSLPSSMMVLSGRGKCLTPFSKRRRKILCTRDVMTLPLPLLLPLLLMIYDLFHGKNILSRLVIGVVGYTLCCSGVHSRRLARKVSWLQGWLTQYFILHFTLYAFRICRAFCVLLHPGMYSIWINRAG